MIRYTASVGLILIATVVRATNATPHIRIPGSSSKRDSDGAPLLGSFYGFCETGDFDLNTEPLLRFFAHQTTTSRSKPEHQLHCSNCAKSGVPPHVNCSNSNTDSRESAIWSCVGIFPDSAYVIVAINIDCENVDPFHRSCMKKGSCVLRFSSKPTTAVDWLLLFGLSQIVLIVVGVIIYKWRKKLKNKILRRGSRRRPDLRIDVVEARRRGREEIRQLKAVAAAESAAR